MSALSESENEIHTCRFISITCRLLVLVQEYSTGTNSNAMKYVRTK